MDFVAIDVETANSDMASICQIGLAVFKQGAVVDEWSTLVNPEDYFDYMNMEIHGITPEAVQGQPTLPQIFDKLRNHVDGKITVCHTHFDRRAVARALEKYELPSLPITWLDSARVVRRTWPQFAQKGYGLGPVSEMLGYKFKHHDALEDAKAAGVILCAALKESQHDLDFWLQRVTQPIDPSRSSSGDAIQRDGDPEGQFFGEILVFTGELEIPRNQAADIAAKAGFKVDQGVTKKTTILVVGTQDARKIKGGEKSAKHLKAEDLAQKGRHIRIIQEHDFFAMTSQ
jgi:DNA polymerase III subunit epsilon